MRNKLYCSGSGSISPDIAEMERAAGRGEKDDEGARLNMLREAQDGIWSEPEAYELI